MRSVFSSPVAVLPNSISLPSAVLVKLCQYLLPVDYFRLAQSSKGTQQTILLVEHEVWAHWCKLHLGVVVPSGSDAKLTYSTYKGLRCF